VMSMMLLRTAQGMKSFAPPGTMGAVRGARVPRAKVSELFAKGFFGVSSSSASAEKDPGAVAGTHLRVLKYPHPQLRGENAPITAFDEALAKEAREMLLVMYAADGIGLAAPQVGLNKRLMVFNEKGEADESAFEMVLANPTIVARADEEDLKEEGCLSFPIIYGKVHRATWIEVQYNTLAGDTVTERFEGVPARIFQHEYDHLDRTLFIDRLVEEDRLKMQRRLNKMVKKYGPGGAV